MIINTIILCRIILNKTIFYINTINYRVVISYLYLAI